MPKQTKIESPFIPCEGRLIVTIPAVEEMSEGGVLIAASAQRKKNEVVVVAVGHGPWDARTKSHEPLPFHPGQRVIIEPNAPGFEVKHKGESYGVVSASDVAAILVDTE